MKKVETIKKLKSIKSRMGWEGFEEDCLAIDEAIIALEKELEEERANSMTEQQKEVLDFINQFLYNQGEDNVEVIRLQFRNGYCLHFAEMLKAIFKRGEVCWCSGLGHMVWVDDDGTPYDIEGINESECDYYIPVSYIEEGLDDFRHIPGTSFNATEEYVQNAVKSYEMNIHYNKRAGKKLMTVDFIYAYMKETGNKQIKLNYLRDMIEFILNEIKGKSLDFGMDIEVTEEEIRELVRIHYFLDINNGVIESEYNIIKDVVPDEIKELIVKFIDSKKTISFKDIKEDHLAIHFSSKKELDNLIDYLNKEGYKLGTGGKSILEIKDYSAAYFSGINYLSLNRENSNKFVSIGLGFYDKEYEFSEIDFS